MIKKRDEVSSPTHCGPMPWGMAVFLVLLFLSCRPTLSSFVVARIEEIEKKSQWIKDSGKELDLDLYGELTWLYRLLQGKNRDGQKGNTWEHLQHQQFFHFPTLHCNDAASKMISPSYPMWVQIMRFCLVLIWKKKRSHIPSICQNPQQELDDEFHFVLCARRAHYVNFYFVTIQFSFYPEGAGRKLWLCSSCGALWWGSRHSCQETLLGFERGENWGYV